MKYLGLIILIIIASFLAWGIFFNTPDTGDVAGEQAEEKTPLEKEIDTSAEYVTLQTNFGEIRIRVDHENAPKTAENFVKLAGQGFYDGLTIHRVIPGFVIQGGDPNGDGTGGPGYTLPAEIEIEHKRGTVAMARLPDQVNPERRSSGSQFYIALRDLPSLDGQYTVFGRVEEGMDVVDQVARVQTDANDKPIEDVIIEKAVIN